MDLYVGLGEEMLEAVVEVQQPSVEVLEGGLDLIQVGRIAMEGRWGMMVPLAGGTMLMLMLRSTIICCPLDVQMTDKSASARKRLAMNSNADSEKVTNVENAMVVAPPPQNNSEDLLGFVTSPNLMESPQKKANKKKLKGRDGEAVCNSGISNDVDGSENVQKPERTKKSGETKNIKIAATFDVEVDRTQ